MILQRLTLHNIGVYEGRQTIELETEPGKPVVLIGGLNGCGKTTVLDALQLALYGNRARTSNRNGSSYDRYLGGTINARRGTKEGAGVELEFKVSSEGAPHVLRVVRTFTLSTSGVREELAVFSNGTFDRVLTDNWAEYVEEILPLEISQLFFFDGEKIQALADSDQAGGLVRTAVYSLLGLNLIERLSSDLTTLTRRKRILMHNEETKERIDQRQSELEAAEAQRDQYQHELSDVRTEIDRVRRLLNDAETRYRSEGGEVYDRRNEIEERRRESERRVEKFKESLRELAGGLFPLVLVEGLLERTLDQAEREESETQARRVDLVLANRDRAISARLAEILDESALSQVVELFEADRIERKGRESVSLVHDLQPRSVEVVRRIHRELMKSREEAEATLLALAEAEAGLANHERELNAVPNPERLHGILTYKGELQTQLDSLNDRLATVEELVGRSERDVEAKEAALVREIERQVDLDFDQEADSRIVAHAVKAQSTLERFQQRLIEAHLHEIENAVTEAFRRLLRKATLVENVSIKPSDFSVHVVGQDGREIASDRLSAGERQLLAVALLWGLATVSGRSLPAIIDTPLGRLDSIHRGYLVERYFPQASHQVILLSTDEEIDETLHGLLAPAMSHQYCLDYQDDISSTVVREGYFWTEAAHAR